MATNIVGATGIDKVQDGIIVNADIDTVDAGKLTGTVADARISTLTASKLTGALPAISGASLTNLPATDISGKLNLSGGTMTGTLVLNSVRLDTQTANNSSTHLVQRMGSTAGSYGYIDFEVENPASTAATYPRFNMEIGNSKVLQLIRGGSVRVGPNTQELGKAMLSTWQNNTEAGTSIGGTNLALALQHYGGANSVVQLGMGYCVNHPPAVIGYKVDTNSNNTKGDLFFATRNNTTDIAPSIRLRIDTEGALTTEGFSTGGSTYGYKLEGANQQYTFYQTQSGNGNMDFHRYYNSSGYIGRIRYSGGSLSFENLSDYRAKENVVDMPSATDRLKQLKPKRYNLIKNSSITLDGFLAHEVAPVCPEAVGGEKDAVDEDGNPDMQMMDNSKLVPLLVKTIQELEAR